MFRSVVPPVEEIEFFFTSVEVTGKIFILICD